MTFKLLEFGMQNLTHRLSSSNWLEWSYPLICIAIPSSTVEYQILNTPHFQSKLILGTKVWISFMHREYGGRGGKWNILQNRSFDLRNCQMRQYLLSNQVIASTFGPFSETECIFSGLQISSGLKCPNFCSFWCNMYAVLCCFHMSFLFHPFLRFGSTSFINASSCYLIDPSLAKRHHDFKRIYGWKLVHYILAKKPTQQRLDCADTNGACAKDNREQKSTDARVSYRWT